MAQPRILLALVLVATAAAHAPAIDGEFLFDDEGTISSPLVANPSGAPASAWLRATRPTTTLTFAANRLASGFDPRAWHLTNVAIHLCAALLAYALARLTLARAGLSRPEGAALLAAALFALHPIQTESVAYVTQRSESLASALYLGGLLLFLARDRATAPLRRGALAALATALHAIALGAKPIAATLPAAWLLHLALLPPPGEEAIPGWRRALRRLPAAAPALALSAAAGIVAIRGTAGSISAGYDIPGLGLGDYLATQLRVVPAYLRLLAWPAGQCVDWDVRPSQSLLEPRVLLGGLLLLSIAGAALGAARLAAGRAGDGPAAARAASFGALFFFLALAPTSLVPLADPMAEHRLYLASLGFHLAVCGAGAFVLRRFAPRLGPAFAAVAVLLVLASAVATARRSAVWTTRLALWSDAAEKAPGKPRVHLQLGFAQLGAQRPEDALRSFQRAREVGAGQPHLDEPILVAIVGALVALGRVEEARAETERAIAGFPGVPGLLAMRAQVEFHAGDFRASERAALAALAASEGHAKALKYLGLSRMRQGDLAGARAALRASAAAGYTDALVYFVLGEAERLAGDRDAACAAYATGAHMPVNPWAAGRSAESHRALGCR